MRIILTGFLATLVLCACLGCQPAAKPGPDQPGAGAANGDSGAGAPTEPVSITTGDVEQRVFFNAALAKEAEAPNIKSDVKEDSRGKTNMVTLDVYQPFPTSLPLLFRARSNRNWDETPLVCRGKVTIEGNPEPIGGTQFVWGKQAIQNPQEMTVDIMPALATVPDSVLVYMRVEALLMPIGTDAATVDPATATAPEMSSTELLSNPVRINFHNEPAPAAAGEAVPAPAAVAPVAPVETPAAPAQ